MKVKTNLRAGATSQVITTTVKGGISKAVPIVLPIYKIGGSRCVGI
jgi:hypothetical protein